MQCGAALGPGVRFCGGCGRPAELGNPAPPAPSLAPVSPTQQPAHGWSGGAPNTEFEVLVREPYRMAKITLRNSMVTLEAGQLHYMIGNIQMTAQAPTLGGIAKSFLTKEKAVRPVYSGTGVIYLEPTFGELNVLEIRPGENWILDKGAYVASDAGVAIGMYTNPAFQSIFGGEGRYQTEVSGHGKLIYYSPGPVERIDLNGDTLTVDGSFAVARTGSLEYRVEKASKGMFGSWISGEGLVSTFRGYGSVMVAPIPNRFVALLYQFNGLHQAIRAIQRS
jgi:uncharacterized protein (AIM24 family)